MLGSGYAKRQLEGEHHEENDHCATRDGTLDVGSGEVVGRGAIKAAVANMPGGRHHITNLVLRIDGEWLFAKRRIYNEGNAAWAAPPGNPAW